MHMYFYLRLFFFFYINFIAGWIVFLQAIGLLELVMLVFSFLTQLVLFVKVKRVVAYVSLGSTAIACKYICSALHRRLNVN